MKNYMVCVSFMFISWLMVAMDNVEAKKGSTQQLSSLGTTISDEELFDKMYDDPTDIAAFIGSLEREKSRYGMLLEQVHCHEKYRNSVFFMQLP